MEKTSKRLALVALLCLMAGIQAFAEELFTENGFTYSILKYQCTHSTPVDSSALELTKYAAVSTVDYSQPLHIPASVCHNGKTYAVKRICDKAFKDVSEVQQIIIDEGIENIGKFVFEGCGNLKAITIPSSVESIGYGLFGNCPHLTSITVSSDNKTFDSRDGANAIIDSDNNELIVACSATKIPSSVTSIGEWAFCDCTDMEQLTIPEGVESIGNHAFFGCTNLRSVKLPESLKEIGSGAFYGCNSLTSIVIPKNVKEIDRGDVFADCSSLTSVVVK